MTAITRIFSKLKSWCSLGYSTVQLKRVTRKRMKEKRRRILFRFSINAECEFLLKSRLDANWIWIVNALCSAQFCGESAWLIVVLEVQDTLEFQFSPLHGRWPRWFFSGKIPPGVPAVQGNYIGMVAYYLMRRREWRPISWTQTRSGPRLFTVKLANTTLAQHRFPDTQSPTYHWPLVFAVV